MVNWGSPDLADGHDGARPGRMIERRALLGGFALLGAFAVSGCATTGLRRAFTSDAEPVRRLMRLSSERAFTWLVQPDGFWTSPVARIPLPVLFTRTGATNSRKLRSADFRMKLQRQLNTIASQSAVVAAPLVAQAAKQVAIPDPAEVLGGGRTAATTLLRKAMGPALVNAMLPDMERAMQQTGDPTLGEAIAALKGVTITDAAHALALEADNAIWYEIGSAEAAIRQDPAPTGDSLLIATFKAA